MSQLSSAAQDRPIVIASNRGPISYSMQDGRPVARRGGGGLVSGLAPLVESGRARWIAAALSPADREAVRTGADNDGLDVTLLDLDEDDHALAYDTISNETLWFIHHGLYDLTRSPSYDDRWWDGWDAYRRVNRAFADAVCDTAPDGAAVLVQDYHLTLLAPSVRQQRPDLSLVHFHHTPFAGPDGLRVLPPAARDEMLSALDAHHACGFHVEPWVENFADSRRRWPTPDGADSKAASLFASTLSSDAADLLATADSPECIDSLASIEEWLDGRKLFVRIDRMELSKNIVRGFDAYGMLLERRPDLRGAVSFLACCYPSRENVEEYARYRDEVIAAADRVNDRWGTADWQPVRLETNDDYPRSVAALTRYDVLLVNPVRDGLNLVAKEGPVLNRNDGLLVLSNQAGAYAELHEHCSGVHPFDLNQTAAALERCLDADAATRSVQSSALRERAAARTPADWLEDQLRAAG